MYSFRISIASHILQIDAPYKIVKDFFLDFLSDDSPELSIVLSDGDLIAKKYVYGKDNALLGWEGRIDISILLQKVADELLSYDVFLLHGAAISLNNAGFIFIAPSGTGKTTHIMKWIEKCKDVIVINGDKPFIKISDEEVPLIYGSPWAGKEEMYSKITTPLKAIIILERAENNIIERISFTEAFPSLLYQTYRPEDADRFKKTLRLLQKMSTSVSFWRFQCNNFKDDCFDVSYKALTAVDTNEIVSAATEREKNVF